MESEQAAYLTGVLWGFPFTLAAMLGKHPELLGGKVLKGCEKQRRRAQSPTMAKLWQTPPLPQSQGGRRWQ